MTKLNTTRTQEIVHLTQQVERLKNQIANKNNNKYLVQIGNDSISDDVYTYAEVQEEIIDSLTYELEELRDNEKLEIPTLYRLINNLENNGECTMLTVYDINNNVLYLCDFFDKNNTTELTIDNFEQLTLDNNYSDNQACYDSVLADF